MNQVFESEIVLGRISDLLIGLSWDMFDKNAAVDLDASCVFFDGFGRIVDAVYYNQLETSYAKHSGDNRTGEGEGFDETIQISLTKMDDNIQSFMVVINAYTGGNFSNVETALANLMNPSTGESISEISVGCNGSHTGLIFCCVYKKGNEWYLRQLNRNANGRNFKEIEGDMREELTFLVPKDVSSDVMVWDSSRENTKTFNMKKGDVVQLRNSATMRMGLGWDTKCDLDASIIEVRYDLSVAGIVMFSRKTNANNSIRHSGDNLTGEGEGDDETIFMDLDNIDPNVAMLVCVVNVFTNLKYFDDVQGAYCRLVSNKNNREVCRYNLTNRTEGKAMIMALVIRDGLSGVNDRNKWLIKAIGEETKGETAKVSQPHVIEYLGSCVEYVELMTSPLGKRYCEMKLMEVESNMLEHQEKWKALDERVDELQLELERCMPTRVIPNRIRMKASAQKVDKMDWFGKSDPYYIIKDNVGYELYKSEVIKVTLDPVWSRHDVNMVEMGKIYTIDVFDWDRHSSDDFIGTFQFDPRDVENGRKTYDIINPKKQKKKKKYKNSGVFSFDMFQARLTERNPEYGVLQQSLEVAKKDREDVKRQLDRLKGGNYDDLKKFLD